MAGQDWPLTGPPDDSSRFEAGTGGRLDGYRYLPATKGDLLTRLGRHEDAAEAYRAALQLTDNAMEREFLSERLG